jgi:hypothetical protein
MLVSIISRLNHGRVANIHIAMEWVPEICPAIRNYRTVDDRSVVHSVMTACSHEVCLRATQFMMLIAGRSSYHSYLHRTDIDSKNSILKGEMLGGKRLGPEGG